MSSSSTQIQLDDQVQVQVQDQIQINNQSIKSIRFLTTPPLPPLKATISFNFNSLISDLSFKILLTLLNESNYSPPPINHRLVLEQSHGFRLPAAEPCSILLLNQLVIVRLLHLQDLPIPSSIPSSSSLPLPFPTLPSSSSLTLPTLPQHALQISPLPHSDSLHLNQQLVPSQTTLNNFPSSPTRTLSPSSGSEFPFPLPLPPTHFSPTPDWPASMLAAHEDSSSLSSAEPSPAFEIPVLKNELSSSPNLPVPSVRTHIAPFRKSAKGHYRKTSSSSSATSSSDSSQHLPKYKKPRTHLSAPQSKLVSRNQTSSSSWQDDQEQGPLSHRHPHRSPISRSDPGSNNRAKNRVSWKRRLTSCPKDKHQPRCSNYFFRTCHSGARSSRKSVIAKSTHKQCSSSSSEDGHQEVTTSSHPSPRLRLRSQSRSCSRSGKKRVDSRSTRRHSSSSSWQDEDDRIQYQTHTIYTPRSRLAEIRNCGGTHIRQNVKVVIRPTRFVAPTHLDRANPWAQVRSATTRPRHVPHTSPPAQTATSVPPSTGRAQRAVYQIFFVDQLFKAASTQGPQRHAQSASGLNDGTTIRQLVRHLKLEMNSSWKLMIGDKVWLSDWSRNLLVKKRDGEGSSRKAVRLRSGLVDGKIVQNDWLVRLKELGVVPSSSSSIGSQGLDRSTVVVKVIKNWDLD